MAGRPRTPTSLLEMKGAFRKNPARGRAREHEPQVEEPLGPPPACFVAQAEFSQEGRDLLAIWDELSRDVPPGVLNRSHRIHFEMACRLTWKARRPGAKLSVYTALEKYTSKMGLNPSDSSRVSGERKVKPGAVGSALAEIAESTRGARRA